jgi:hypothetical protein
VVRYDFASEGKIHARVFYNVALLLRFSKCPDLEKGEHAGKRSMVINHKRGHKRGEVLQLEHCPSSSLDRAAQPLEPPIHPRQGLTEAEAEAERSRSRPLSPVGTWTVRSPRLGQMLEEWQYVRQAPVPRWVRLERIPLLAVSPQRPKRVL